MECMDPPTDIKVEVKKESIIKKENNNNLITNVDVKSEIKDPFDCSSDESSSEKDDNTFEDDTDKKKATDFKETSEANINVFTQKAPISTDKVGRKWVPPHYLEKHYTTLVKNEYSNEYEYECNHCKFVAKKKKYISKHIRIIHLKIGKVYQCPYCPYNSRFEIDSHITSRHKKDSEIKWYTCHECGHKSKLRSGFQRHVLTHKSIEERMDKMKKCEICSKMYRDQRSLRRHISVVHEKTQKLLRCGTCDYTTHIKLILERHIKQFHTEDDENLEMLKCDKCNYKTKFEYLLKAHSRKHLPRRFQCEKCPYQAIDRPHLKLHEINHKEVKNDVDLKYRCDKCDYKTYRQYSFSVHKLKHLKPEEIQYFYCYHCDFKAKRKDNLKTHIHNHFKKKGDFVCFVCDFKTKNKVTHLAHIEKHSREPKDNFKISITSSKGPQTW